MIKMLVNHGADIYAVNMQGINIMHVAAQGDQPYSIAYFMSLGLDINSRDKRKSTPLHWAAVSGAELTLTYVIALGGDLEAMDVKGHTALHFACKKHKENKSTKGIKQLLLKGANRNAMDYEGKRPIDYVQNESKPSA
jgi:palmitoyltransferase